MVGTLNLTGENVSHIMTKPGQAHFARVDTSNTCRECLQWVNQKGERDSQGNLKEARCQKALRALNNPPPIPHNAWACRHFELNTAAPTI